MKKSYHGKDRNKLQNLVNLKILNLYNEIKKIYISYSLNMINLVVKIFLTLLGFNSKVFFIFEIT